MDTTQSTPVVSRIEREIARLTAARPHLATRIERAEHILVTHLSTANGTYKPIKVRVRADGSRSFVVRSGAKLRTAYTVSGSAFRCDCPDHRRRHSACKHGIACFVLERALRRPSPLSGGTCAGCSGKRERLFEVVDSLTFFAEDMICEGCAGNTASEVV